jgi:hypothetical protein
VLDERMETNSILKTELNFDSVRKRNPGGSSMDRNMVGKYGNGLVN